MTNDEIIKHMERLIAKHGTLEKSLKFDFNRDGQIHIDGTTVSETNETADCVVKVSKKNFLKIVKGQLNPMTAMMMGSVRISGDKSVVMGLQKLFRK